MTIVRIAKAQAKRTREGRATIHAQRTSTGETAAFKTRTQAGLTWPFDGKGAATVSRNTSRLSCSERLKTPDPLNALSAPVENP